MSNDTTTTAGPHALTLCHTNGRGTGSAVRIYANPAKHGRDGFLTIKIAPQNGPDTFDWADSVAMTLKPVEIAEALMVLGGHCAVLVDRGTEGVTSNMPDRVAAWRISSGRRTPAAPASCLESA